MLKRYSNKNEIQNDTLISSITQFYVPYLQIITDNNQMIKKEVLENIDDFKTKPWFVDWTQGKVTKEMIAYFTESDDYRKKVAANLIFAVRNHKQVITSYKKNAAELIKGLQSKIQED